MSRAINVTSFLLVAGIVLHHIDLVVLAVPFAIGTAFSLRRRPGHLPLVRDESAGGVLAEGSKASLSLLLGNRDPVAYDLVVVRTRVSRWLAMHHADRPYAARVKGGTVAEITFNGTATRWG